MDPFILNECWAVTDFDLLEAEFTDCDVLVTESTVCDVPDIY